METVSVTQLPNRYQRCRHNRVPVAAIIGRGTYVFCDISGCWRDAYRDRDLAVTAGTETRPTVERPVADRYGHTFQRFGAGVRCERCTLVPIHPGDETEPCTEGN